MGQLGLLNLIVAIIVDRAAGAREEDQELQQTLKEEELKTSYMRLQELFRIMDSDGSESLDLEELKEGYDENEAFRNILRLMDITRDDMETVFEILDQNHDGVVAYEEFVTQLHYVKFMNSHSLLVFIRYYCETLGQSMRRFETLLTDLRTDLQLEPSLIAPSAQGPSAADGVWETLPSDDAEFYVEVQGGESEPQKMGANSAPLSPEETEISEEADQALRRSGRQPQLHKPTPAAIQRSSNGNACEQKVERNVRDAADPILFPVAGDLPPMREDTPTMVFPPSNTNASAHNWHHSLGSPVSRTAPSRRPGQLPSADEDPMDAGIWWLPARQEVAPEAPAIGTTTTPGMPPVVPKAPKAPALPVAASARHKAAQDSHTPRES